MLCQQSLRTDCPSTDEIATIKAMLIRDYGESEGDNKVSTNYILLLMATLIIKVKEINGELLYCCYSSDLEEME
jgi:hypothetical protein